MNDIGELHGILDEEDGDVVTDNVPVTLLCIKLYSKTTDITHSVGTASATEDCGEADEDRSFARLVREDRGEGEVIHVLEDPEGTEGASAPGVNNSLGNTLVVEPVDLSMLVNGY